MEQQVTIIPSQAELERQFAYLQVICNYHFPLKKTTKLQMAL